MAEAARSRRWPARQARWSATRTEEEARAYLQERLTLFSKLMFWSIATLLIFLAAMYRIYPIAPKHNDLVFGGATVGLLGMAFLWRGLLVRRKLSVRALYRIDLVYATCIGTGFGVSAALSPDLRPAGYASLIYACFTVFTRALVIPSSGRRTAAISTATFVPMHFASVWLVSIQPQDLPGPAYVVGGILFSVIAILLATIGSKIIYGLRQKVTEAMQLGVYTLDGKIGEGGMGAVYRARHSLLRRPTAIKLLLPDRVGADMVDRFEREVQHMSELTHPNTVAVFDYGRNPDGMLYYAMEYLDGLNLDQLVRRDGPQPADRVVHILAQVCGALQEAHDRGLVHRDIKPANIILCERGGMPDFAKVVDFGLVKEITRDTSDTAQMVLGTPGYVAPESITDPATTQSSVDLYALGATGYFLLTGRKVFEGKTAIEIMIQAVKDAPRRPSELLATAVPTALEDVLMRCLAKAPEDRHPSASALADELRALPRAGDWSDQDARAWWRKFRTRPATPVSASAETLTIEVDLHRRGAA